MDFGLVLQTDPPARRVVELAQRAEVYGFTHVWVYDSPVLWQEPFVILARILAETERITASRIGGGAEGSGQLFPDRLGRCP